MPYGPSHWGKPRKFAQSSNGHSGSSLTARVETATSTTRAGIVPIVPGLGVETVRFRFARSQARRLELVRRCGPTIRHEPGVPGEMAWTSSQKSTFESGRAFGAAASSPVLSSPDDHPFGNDSRIWPAKKYFVVYV